MALHLARVPRRSPPVGQVLLDRRWMTRIHACVDCGSLVSFLNGSVGVSHQGGGSAVRGSGYWTLKLSREGYRASAMSYNQISVHPPRQLITLSEFTLFGVGFIGSAAGATTQILATIANLIAPTYLADIIFNRTSGKIEARIYKGGWVTIDSGITFDYNRTYSCVLTAKSGYAELWVDGRRVATDSSAGWVTYNSFRDLCLGNSEYDYFRLNGGVLLGGVTRYFSPQDAQQISQNPWTIFRYPESITFPSTSGTSTRTVTPSGGVTFNGAGSYARVRALSTTGGLQFGGEATVSYVGLQTRVVTPSGGISLSGAAAKAAARNETPTGGITFGGAAAASFHESVRTVTPSGGITFSGAAYVYIPSVGAVATYQKFIYGRKGLATRKYR